MKLQVTFQVKFLYAEPLVKSPPNTPGKTPSRSPNSETSSHSNPPHTGSCLFKHLFTSPGQAPARNASFQTTGLAPPRPRAWLRRNRTTPPPFSGPPGSPAPICRDRRRRASPASGRTGRGRAALGGAPGGRRSGWAGQSPGWAGQSPGWAGQSPGWAGPRPTGAAGVRTPPLYSGGAGGRSPSGSARRRGGGAMVAVIVRLSSAGFCLPRLRGVSLSSFFSAPHSRLLTAAGGAWRSEAERRQIKGRGGGGAVQEEESCALARSGRGHGVRLSLQVHHHRRHRGLYWMVPEQKTKVHTTVGRHCFRLPTLL
ncbi:uncharacterized protein WM277_001039 [Molossus nigricans]